MLKKKKAFSGRTTKRRKIDLKRKGASQNLDDFPLRPKQVYKTSLCNQFIIKNINN